MFTLDERLAADSFLIKDFALCQLRLINNANFPWVILVPKVSEVSEIMDLSDGQRLVLFNEVNLVGNLMKEVFAADKINIAALGNQVSQLHIHIIARFKGDKAWPQPIWGAESTPYSEEGKSEVIERIVAL
jgi:diadenosine tetraphosphate (Ap4A) HIT family hydrolase